MNLPSFLRPFVRRSHVARLDRELTEALARRKAHRLARYPARSEAARKGWITREGRA